MKAAALALIALLAGHHCPQEWIVIPDGKPDFDRTQGLDVSDLPRLCARKPGLVVCQGHAGKLLTYADVVEVDTAYRALFEYRGDDQLYGSDDYYNAPVRCGDCEDYALTMSELLARDGASGTSMSLLLLLDCDIDGCEGHAKLWVFTSDRGLIELDNMDAPHGVWWTSPIDIREAVVSMDGKHRIVPLPGYHFDKDGVVKN